MAAHFSFKEDANEGQNEILVLGTRAKKEGEGNENLLTAPHTYLQGPFMMKGGPTLIRRTALTLLGQTLSLLYPVLVP